MKSLITGVLAALLLAACTGRRTPAPAKRQTPRSSAKSEQARPFESLTGVLIRKGWTKSRESWNAGGSEYYVLKVERSALPSDKRTTKEGVILRPSKAIPFEHFTNFIGQSVICKGEFVTGKPYIPPADSAEQVPSPVENLLGEVEHPIRGSGFKVYNIDLIEEK